MTSVPTSALCVLCLQKRASTPSMRRSSRISPPTYRLVLTSLFLPLVLFVSMKALLRSFRAMSSNTAPKVEPLTATASELQSHLTKGELTSVDLVHIYLQHIRQHDGYLKALISTAPQNLLLERATLLDHERKSGALRSRLHGIPIIIKDNIATDPCLGLKTTAGNFALAEARVKDQAEVVDLLLSAGLILLGKASLTELSNFKGNGVPAGFSAVGGQGQSAYVKGGLRDDDVPNGHSSPGGSSSGPAIGVSAGFAPLALGTETQGSLVSPANRAAIYTLKATHGLLSQFGVVPISPSLDTVGPMTKTVEDLVDLLHVLRGNASPTADLDLHNSRTGKWDDLTIATVEPSKWRAPPGGCRPVPEATEQMETETNDAYQRIAKLAKNIHLNVPLPPRDNLFMDGASSIETLLDAEFRDAFNSYLSGLEMSPVRTLAELIQYNKDHRDIELPPGKGDQSELEDAEKRRYADGEIDKIREFMRRKGRAEGLDPIFEDYQADALIGPADSKLSEYAAAAGYPIATLPLSRLKYNGRPFGLVAIAKGGKEDRLVKVMSAWEASFPPRVVPDLGSLGGQSRAKMT